MHRPQFDKAVRIALAAKKKGGKEFSAYITSQDVAQLEKLSAKRCTSGAYVACVAPHYRYVGGALAADERAVLLELFAQLAEPLLSPGRGKVQMVSKELAIDALRGAGAEATKPTIDVASIVALADRSRDGYLDATEFCVAAHIVAQVCSLCRANVRFSHALRSRE